MSETGDGQDTAEIPASVGYCRACGAALDETTVRSAQGAIYCAAHVPVEAAAADGSSAAPPPLPFPNAAPAGNKAQPTLPAAAFSNPPFPQASGTAHNSPALAFLLGWIPGVGAVYNGQYAKGLVHVLILGSLISILSNDAANGFEALFGLLIAAFFFYMAFEAYHTAKKRAEGQPVDEFSSLFPVRGAGSRFPMVAALLILFGVLFLLSNLDLLELHRLVRFWPVALIVLGAYMLYERFTAEKASKERD